jgi:hypothetical protein
VVPRLVNFCRAGSRCWREVVFAGDAAHIVDSDDERVSVDFLLCAWPGFVGVGAGVAACG